MEANVENLNKSKSLGTKFYSLGEKLEGKYKDLDKIQRRNLIEKAL